MIPDPPRLAVARTPLQALIDERWTGTQRTTQVAKGGSRDTGIRPERGQSLKGDVPAVGGPHSCGTLGQGGKCLCSWKCTISFGVVADQDIG